MAQNNYHTNWPQSTSSHQVKLRELILVQRFFLTCVPPMRPTNEEHPPPSKNSSRSTRGPFSSKRTQVFRCHRSIASLRRCNVMRRQKFCESLQTITKICLCNSIPLTRDFMVGFNALFLLHIYGYQGSNPDKITHLLAFW